MRPAFAEQVAQVLDGVEEVLGSEIVGAYLYGSAVRGGLRPAATSTSSSSPAGQRPHRSDGSSSIG
jgi:predicted nucleotidyltransferase